MRLKGRTINVNDCNVHMVSRIKAETIIDSHMSFERRQQPFN